ncbi:MAG: nitroreductase [Oscillospiraceae bacterium]|jgi:hypothetical protein|nr:nitroreductase [Oscillospiraceae bacterium]
MELYDTIFTRRSVRKYDMTPLDGAALAEIRAFLDTTTQLTGQNARFEIVGADRIKNAAAPHYILAYCAANDSAYANVGYVLQNADLHLQSLGFGSLWLGSAKPSEPEADYCIMLAFGKTDVPPRRDLRDFKRLPIGDISNADDAIAQAARLAPSAMNSQPWFFDFSDGNVSVNYAGRGVSKLLLRKKLSKIDLGIATRHVEVALLHEGRTVLAVTPKTDGRDFAVEVTYQ